jgi:hypothetical protein
MHYYPRREPQLFPPLAYSEGFLRLWQSYPTRGRKRKSYAYSVFLRRGLDNGKLESVIQSVELHKKTEKWHKADGQYIPEIGNYLYYRRDEDEIDPAEIVWGAD